MFLLGLIYLIILVVYGVFGVNWPDARGRWGGLASFALFLIIGIVLFYAVLSKG